MKRGVIAAGGLLACLLLLSSLDAAGQTVAVDGASYVNHGLVGVGRLPATLRDKLGETFGSSSGMAIEPQSWKRAAEGYEGVLLLLPDRGYNVAGTTDYRPRVNRVAIRFTPADGAAPLPADRQQSGVVATLTDSLVLTDAAGQPLTGLDPEGVRAAAGGLPDLPEAANKKVSLGAEAIARLPDGSFFIGDEYGPYLYRFSADGRMLSAIRPPDAFIPLRHGVENFSSNNPGAGAKAPDPANPDAGRQNNQGFEGVALTPDGRKLVAVLQSAPRQDGGDASGTRRYTRALVYDVADPAQPRLTGEYVVPLPTFKDAKGKTAVAAQSELVALSDTLFLLLCRDSNNGYGLAGDTSLYRRVELLDLSKATNLAGTACDGSTPVAPKGKLDPAIQPATLQSLVDLNDNAQLQRFGLHDGPPNDRNNLSEKWESMALASALDPAQPQDWFLFIGNDNDFITQDGFQVGAPYKAPGGADVDTMLLVYRVTLPGHAGH
jgi:hypothetical protein